MLLYFKSYIKKFKYININKSPGRELNPRPRDYKSRALPD